MTPELSSHHSPAVWITDPQESEVDRLKAGLIDRQDGLRYGRKYRKSSIATFIGSLGITSRPLFLAITFFKWLLADIDFTY
jgi:hypothetical protein